ncbi:MAG: penicillin-binding transpeptidase domain-containing protein [Solirubrobacteraceae bacterium]
MPLPDRPAPGRSRSVRQDEVRLHRRRGGGAVALAGLAFAIGAIAGASHSPPYAHELAERFTAAWARGDYASMYADIDARAQREVTPSEFANSYRGALTTATATPSGLRVTGRAHGASGGGVEVAVRVQTRLWGALSSDFTLPLMGSGSATRIAWSRSLAFPGLRPGERLTRHTTLPRRAALLARDGTVLAEGTAVAAGQRASPLGSFASAVVGTVGPIPAARLEAMEAEGAPADAIVGVSGLELALDSSLRGTPGGELLAEGGRTGTSARVLATATPKAAKAVRTTVSPSVQRAAVTALGGQLGGIVAMVPATGQILAVAGIGLDDLQPPGSTFKMITVTGVLQAGLATAKTVFPYATYATLDGVKLNNANGEECGGTLTLAFAVSCNSVFAPLGAKLGAERLVATAEHYGFNHPPGVPGAAESTLPPASQIQGQLDLGSTAIGQGEVQASALEMATVAATIADGGRRPQPTFNPSPTPARGSGSGKGKGTQVSSAAVAHTVRSMMIDVVREGTGTAAAIPGVTVAGKTGTAELKTASTCPPPAETSSTEERGSTETSSQSCGSAEEEASNTDAWFASFAPALAPRIVVGVLLVQDGAGGTTAAPVARQVLEAGLSAGK